MKKDKKVISILLCTVILLGFGYFLKNYLNGDYDQVKYGDIIKDAKYLYYTVYTSGEGGIREGTLVKVSKDGKEVIPLKKANARRLCIYKGKLYFLNYMGQGDSLWRMNLDGSNYELVDVNFYGDYYINNGKIYYLNAEDTSANLDVYSCTIDLKRKKAMVKGINSFKIYKDKIYTGSHLSDDTTIVNEWDINGKFIRKISSYYNNYGDFKIEDGYLFYCSSETSNKHSSELISDTNGTFDSINSINIKTGEKKTLVKDKVSGYIISYGRIYYSVSNKDKSTSYSCNLKGEKKQKDDNVGIVSISLKDGKDIYYTDGGNNLRNGNVKDSKFSKGEILIPYKKLQSLKIKN